MPYMQESGKKAEDFICGRFTGDEQQSENILVSKQLSSVLCFAL
jgi:hypothetical protein